MSKARDKRIKVTGTGKQLVRRSGICHFNAKCSRNKQKQKGKLHQIKTPL